MMGSEVRYAPGRFHTTVVIPVYFNETSVMKVVESVRQAWIDHGRHADALEFVLVDDGSEDESWQRLLEIHDAWPANVKAIRLVGNHGSQLAILAGAAAAAGDRVAMVAADGQEPAELVARMADAADDGNSLVLATRQSRADSVGTRAGASFFYKLVRVLGLKKMPEEGFDAFLMSREIMNTILEMRDPNIPLSVTIAWLGYPYAAVGYDRRSRAEGQSRWTFAKKLKLALDAITAVSYAPIRAISLFGVAVALLGFSYAIFVVLARLFGGIPVEGWTSLFVAVLIIGGTQLLALGVIGEYLWRTLEVARTRPLWRVAEFVNSVEPYRERSGVDRRGAVAAE
jgi:polyisoprenyl-phosphate glycosyltransferase